MTDNSSPNPTILIVEDYEDTRFTTRLALEGHGYRVLEAASGEAAVEVATQELPDIILMDISLPGLDGLAAVERIRENPDMKEKVIVAVTAHQETDYRAKALAAGCNAYVTKPIDFDWLNDLLRNLLP